MRLLTFRPTRRELSYFAHGLNRCNEPMTAALLEVLCYRSGVRRPIASGSAAEVARKYRVSEQALQRRVRIGVSLLPAAYRNRNRDDKPE